jgi:hypothetical protein
VGNGIAPLCARAARNGIMMNNEVNRIEDREWAKSDRAHGISQMEKQN